MKKILVLVLVVALCIPALFSCQKTGPLDDVAAMYKISAPTKVVATTTQNFGSYELNSRYEIVTGYVDGSPASVYTTEIESVRPVSEGGGEEIILGLVKYTYRKTEAIEGVGSRVTSYTDDEQPLTGKWNPNGTVWVITRGSMAIKLDANLLSDVLYEQGVDNKNINKLTFTIPEANAAAVLDEFAQWAYAEDIVGDVAVTIFDDGAVVTSIELTYNLKGDGENLETSTMTMKVEYHYAIEQINIAQ